MLDGKQALSLPFEERLYFNQSFKALSDSVNAHFKTSFRPGILLDVHSGRMGLHIIDRFAFPNTHLSIQSEFTKMFSCKEGAYRDLLMRYPTGDEEEEGEQLGHTEDINEMIRQLEMLLGRDLSLFL
jgi:hypothetical protein